VGGADGFGFLVYFKWRRDSQIPEHRIDKSVRKKKDGYTIADGFASSLYSVKKKTNEWFDEIDEMNLL